MIADFKEHQAGVTSVQFHPKEFLLATGSADRTALLWDLERFEMVSACGPESNAVRCVAFHPDGSVLFTGAQDSLRVSGHVEFHVFSTLAIYMYGKKGWHNVYTRRSEPASLSQCMEWWVMFHKGGK